jgi:hypothetical protein
MVTVEAARETGVRDAGVEQSMAAALRVRVGVGNGVCGRCGDGRAVRVRATKDEGGACSAIKKCAHAKCIRLNPRNRKYRV